MRTYGKRGGWVALAPVLCMASTAAAVPLTDNVAPTQAGLTAGLVALDLSGIITGLTTNNSLASNFVAPGNAYSGSLTTTVYGNVGTPGQSLDTVLIVYEFTGNGPSGIDSFTFGVDSGINLDFGDLLAATHGTIGDLTSVGQVSPIVDLIDNSGVPANDLMVFDFLPNNDSLGGAGGTETFAWYIMAGGDVAINIVDVESRDFGAVTFQSLSLVNNPGQPDLNVPTPGSIALLMGGVGLQARRRRSVCVKSSDRAALCGWRCE